MNPQQNGSLSNLVPWKKQALLTDYSGQIRPMVLSDAELILLSCYLTQESIDDAISAVKADTFYEPLLSSIDHSSIVARISDFKRVTSKTCLSSFDMSIVPFQYCIDNKDEITHNTQLKTPSNTAIELCEKGFCIWALSLGKFVVLPQMAVSVLFAFGDGGNVGDIIAQKSKILGSEQAVIDIIGRLKAISLLVAPTNIQLPSMEQVPKFNTDTASANLLAKNWHSIDVDGRIPVYFVPHMENHFPLALGVIYNAIAHYDAGRLLEHFVLIPINFLEPKELLQGPYKRFGPGVWLFSNYMWSIELNMQICNAIKNHNAGNLTIHGGPSNPDYPEASKKFLQQNRCVDISCHGEGEITITEIFDCLSRTAEGNVGFDSFKMSQVSGISFLGDVDGKIVRTAPRERMKTPDSVPSPYLSGIFDKYNGHVESAIIETNRGCPYGCTFCDWGSATNSKIRTFDIERVNDEIEWIGKNKIKVLWIADANFGLYARDIEISRMIVEAKRRYGYPREVVVNYTKNSTKKLVEIIKVLNEGGIISQGIISIQTTDKTTLEVIDRKNIRTERYDELVDIFAQQKLPLSTDLMIGLPGTTVSSFSNDLQRYIDMDVSVKAYPTQLLPNSPMADPEYVKKYQIKVDDNNYITSTYSYSNQDLQWMNQLNEAYIMADGYGLLRYVTRFLQWEHNIPAMSFLSDLLNFINKSPATYKLLTWACVYFNKNKRLPGGWKLFYAQVEHFVRFQYHIKADSAFRTVLKVSESVMPDESLSYPYIIKLEHDFSAYFSNYKLHKKALSEYDRGVFTISDPSLLSKIDLNEIQYDSHQYFWELNSDTARPKSSSDFAK